MKIFFITFALWACLITPVATQAQETTIANLIVKLRETVIDIPDCTFEYTIETDRGKDSKFESTKFRYQFIKCKNCFSFKTVSPSEELPEEWATFDGEKYYYYLDGGLVVGRNLNASQIKKPLNALFSSNPLYAPFYYCIFSGKNTTFAYPDMINAERWIESFRDISVSGKEYAITWPNRKRIFELDPSLSYPIKCVTIPNPDNGTRITTEVKKWMKVPLSSQPELFPVEIVQSLSKNGIFERDSVKITLHEGSYKVLSEEVQTSKFKIPVGIARSFYDSDTQSTITR